MSVLELVLPLFVLRLNRSLALVIVLLRMEEPTHTVQPVIVHTLNVQKALQVLLLSRLPAVQLTGPVQAYSAVRLVALVQQVKVRNQETVFVVLRTP